MRPKALLLAALILIPAGLPQDVRAQSKQVPMYVTVEAEGGAKSQGMWSQDANDLTKQEVEDLQTLVSAQLAKGADVKMVSKDYPDDVIGIAVVAAKLPNAHGTTYIASSAIVISKKNGVDELLTHDVFACRDLGLLARNVALQFSAARLSAALSSLK